MTELAGHAEIMQAAAGLVDLASHGVASDDFVRHLGMDPVAVVAFARAIAEEEFDTIPGLPTGIDATGRLRKLKLSANQRKVVKEALTETWIVGLEIGAVLMRARQTGEEDDD